MHTTSPINKLGDVSLIPLFALIKGAILTFPSEFAINKSKNVHWQAYTRFYKSEYFFDACTFLILNV